MYKLTVFVEDHKKTIVLPQCLKIERDDPHIFENRNRVLGLQQFFSKIQR